MLKKTIATIAAVLSTMASAAAFMPTASAAVVQDVVHHKVWMHSNESFTHKTQYEMPGTVLTELSRNSKWIRVKAPNGRVGYVVNNAYYVTRRTSTVARRTSTVTRTSTSRLSTAASSNFHLPPDVRYDYSIRPRAGLGASQQAKANAVLAVAASKLGTPYRWGHNEDRGQYGFDCSNFTAYVYHHALGYKMSGASQTQNHYVGWRISKYAMRPGDLVIFDNGGHVGIYAGNGRMIQEGGGLGKVGYLRLAPGSYWYKHITAVKRMF